jgi:hypothetical protein
MNHIYLGQEALCQEGRWLVTLSDGWLDIFMGVFSLDVCIVWIEMYNISLTV